MDGLAPILLEDFSENIEELWSASVQTVVPVCTTTWFQWDRQPSSRRISLLTRQKAVAGELGPIK
jgi:hypothetical protein